MSFPSTILVAIVAFISAYLWYSPSINFYVINIFFGVILVSFHVAGFNSFNSCFDITEDTITKPNYPLPSRKIKFSTALKITSFTLIIPLILSYFISTTIFILTFIFTVSSLLYSLNPLRLKKLPFINTLTVSMSYSLFPWLLAWLLISKSEFTVVPLLITGGTFSSVIIKDFGDIKGDISVGNKTIPVIFGIKKSISIIKYSTTFLSLLLAIYFWLKMSSILKLLMFAFPVLYFLLGNNLSKIRSNKIDSQIFVYMFFGSIIQLMIGVLSFL